MGYRSILFFCIGLVFILAGLYFESASGSRSALLQEIKQHLTQEITSVEEEAAGLLEADTIHLNGVTHSFFLMDTANVLQWNNNAFLPDIRTVQDEFSTRLLQWPRGIFLLKKWKLENGTFLLGVITFQNRYKINNRYLVSGWNKEIFPTQDVIIGDLSGDGEAFIWEGKPIFKLGLSTINSQKQDTDWLVFNLIICGLLFLVIGGCWGIHRIHLRQHYALAQGLLFLFFVGGRVVVLTFFSSPKFPLFDPIYFASSSYNRSIGDLLVNAICLFIPIVYCFYNFHKFRTTKRITSFTGSRQHIMVSWLLLCCFFVILIPFLFFETIAHNSAISLDVTQSLDFNIIRIASFIAIALSCIGSFMLAHVFIRLVAIHVKGNNILFFSHLLAASILFALISLLLQRNYMITLWVAIVYVTAILILGLYRYLSRTTYTTYIYFLLAIILFALQGAFSIRKFVIEDKINAQFRFANVFLSDRDYLGEYLLGESVERISADPFIQTRLGSPFLSKAVVRQKVKQVYLNAYFDRYDIQIHLFNSTGSSYDNSTPLTFKELITNFQTEANKTNYEGVFFLKNSSAESTKRYLVVIPINRFGMVTGYVVLDLSLKRVIPQNVFPELLLDDRFIQYFKNRDFSYAFYAGDKVTSSFGDFNYENDLPVASLTNQSLFSGGIFENDFLHVGVEDDQGNVTVVSSATYSPFNIITNFSFLFSAGLFTILFGLLLYGITTLYNHQKLNYSARIQLYVYMAFILPLLLVSVTTLGLINRSAEQQLNEEYIEKSKTIGERLAPLIDSFLESTNVSINDLENQLIELSKLANVDATIFSSAGKILTSSQPLIYEDRILSSLLNRDAFEALVTNKGQSFISSEQIGLLTYNSSYHAMRSPETGNLIGIVGLPFFESAYSLERTQISVMSNIITIFCIVFILFSILSFFVVRWLTFPLEFITKTLRGTTLTQSNKPLIWNASDEIGMMVNEYNKMLTNLEQSKIELSRIQKESAWREIAKQVAHEVKNPLTPMKLTLQQMERAMVTDDLSKEKIKKSLQTLLQQVEILNEIAASFSAFARMPAPILERIELTSLVKKVLDLHSDYEEGTVSFNKPKEMVYTMGDTQLLSRVFSNIILNALQSREDDKKITVKVSMQIQLDTCIISFEDNGSGIDQELGEKVFLPHFSTKKSGSGLGLAIAKQGIEQNGGSIRFETKQDEGTVFYVVLPIVQ